MQNPQSEGQDVCKKTLKEFNEGDLPVAMRGHVKVPTVGDLRSSALVAAKASGLAPPAPATQQPEASSAVTAVGGGELGAGGAANASALAAAPEAQQPRASSAVGGGELGAGDAAEAEAAGLAQPPEPQQASSAVGGGELGSGGPAGSPAADGSPKVEAIPAWRLPHGLEAGPGSVARKGPLAFSTPPRAAAQASSPAAGSGAGGPEVDDDAASVASFATSVGTRGGAARQKRKVPARKESETDHDRASIIENAMDYVYILEGGNMGNFTYALRRLPEATTNQSVELIVNRCHGREGRALNLRACVMTMTASVRSAGCDKLKRVDFSRAVTICRNTQSF